MQSDSFLTKSFKQDQIKHGIWIKLILNCYKLAIRFLNMTNFKRSEKYIWIFIQHNKSQVEIMMSFWVPSQSNKIYKFAQQLTFYVICNVQLLVALKVPPLCSSVPCRIFSQFILLLYCIIYTIYGRLLNVSECAICLVLVN